VQAKGPVYYIAVYAAVSIVLENLFLSLISLQVTLTGLNRICFIAVQEKLMVFRRLDIDLQILRVV